MRKRSTNKKVKLNCFPTEEYLVPHQYLTYAISFYVHELVEYIQSRLNATISTGCNCDDLMTTAILTRDFRVIMFRGAPLEFADLGNVECLDVATSVAAKMTDALAILRAGIVYDLSLPCSACGGKLKPDAMEATKVSCVSCKKILCSTSPGGLHGSQCIVEVAARKACTPAESGRWAIFSPIDVHIRLDQFKDNTEYRLEIIRNMQTRPGKDSLMFGFNPFTFEGDARFYWPAFVSCMMLSQMLGGEMCVNKMLSDFGEHQAPTMNASAFINQGTQRATVKASSIKLMNKLPSSMN